jgi:hypothetical protein
MGRCLVGSNDNANNANDNEKSTGRSVPVFSVCGNQAMDMQLMKVMVISMAGLVASLMLP